jgi:hypothetical protein
MHEQNSTTTTPDANTIWEQHQLQERFRVNHMILEHLREAGYTNHNVLTFGMFDKVNGAKVYGIILENKKVIAAADTFGVFKVIQPYENVLLDHLTTAYLEQLPAVRVIEYSPVNVQVTA